MSQSTPQPQQSPKESEPDFEFAFGNNRYLRGRGWRGLVALALLLCGIVVALSIGNPLPEHVLKSIGTARAYIGI